MSAGQAAEVTAPRGLRLPERALPWLSVAGVLVLFEALPRVGLLPEDHFPPMSLILGELASETTDSAFWSALGHTLETILTDPASAVADRATLDKERGTRPFSAAA